MNIIHCKNLRAPVVRPSRPQAAPRLTAVWARDPGTRRLQQAWRLADDADGSCTGRPGGPPKLRGDGGGLRLAA
jgi:hypothetical protein